MIRTNQLLEIGRLIENLGHIASETFIIEGGLKLFNEDVEGSRELVGFIVHDNGGWAYAPPVIPSSQMQIAVAPGVAQIQAPSSQPIGPLPAGFTERMGTPAPEMSVGIPSRGHRVSRAGQSLTDPRETLSESSPHEAQ